MEISDLLHPERLFKKQITDKEMVSTAEAFSLWDLLRARYVSKETHQLFKNFVHDRDFELLINDHLKNYTKQIKILEDLAETYSVPVPSRPAENIKTSAHIDAINDQLIFKRINSDLISELYSLNRTITSTTLNDDLRDLFIDFIDSHLEDYDRLHKYGKVKGWGEITPVFKTNKPQQKEELAASEATHLWDLLGIRYDQMQLTSMFLGLIHDEDLKQIVKRGNKVLQNQIKEIENKAQKYEVPLPKKPPAHQKIELDPEVISDNFIYRTILNGIRDAVSLHIRSMIETIRNDKIRDFFYELYKTEINLYGKLIKYGNAKGWMNVTPTYERG